MRKIVPRKAKLLLETDVVTMLLSSGLVNAEQIVASGVQIYCADRRNRNFILKINADLGFFVKQAKQIDAMKSVANETKILQMLSDSSGPDTCRYFPSLVLDDNANNMIVTRFIPGRHLSTNTNSFREIRELDMYMLGRTIGQLHRQRLPEIGRRNWLPTGLLLQKPTLSLMRNTSMANIRLIQTVQAHPGLCRLLDEARSQWRPRTLIHGDLKFDNLCLATEDGAERLMLFDWELACAGDPGWDVGSVLGELLRIWLAHDPAEEAVSRPADDPAETVPAETRLEIFQGLVKGLFNGYGSIATIDEAFIAACVRLAVVRLLQTAFEGLQFKVQVDLAGAKLLQMTCNLAARPEILSEIIFARHA